MTGPELTFVAIRGAGDLGTGVAWRLRAAGFPVIALELRSPLTVRRTVSLSSVVSDPSGMMTIEGQLVARLVDTTSAARTLAGQDNVVPVMISSALPADLRADVVVDARLAKSPLDCSLGDAPLVIGLGPGFVVGEHCHAVIETQRGPRLGRVLWEGSASPNTGTPGSVGGRSAERVLRTPIDGVVRWEAAIGDVVREGQAIGSVVGERQRVPVLAPFAGLVRGLLADGTHAKVGLKIGDVDPRVDVRPHEISDKALSIGGGVTEAIFTWLRRRG